jgi:hypothetical protein
MKKFTLFALILSLGMMAGALNAQILHVPSDYTTIQEAVDASTYGDTILVAPGTYLENVRIQGNDRIITLASNFMFSGDTADISNTIIDASQPQNPNFGMGILIKNQDSTLSTAIVGLTITGGTGYYKTYGGGIYTNNVIPVIEYNYIQNCSVTGTQPNGAGIYVGPYYGDTTKFCLISHNIIKNCTITSTVNGVEAAGAGMSVNSVNADIENNLITDNIIIGNETVQGLGAGIYYFKSNFDMRWPFVTIKNNEIRDNRTESWHAQGAGVFMEDTYANIIYTIDGNTITGNEAVAVGAGGYAAGGGISIYNPADGSVISNNTVSDNIVLDGPAGSTRWGGGIYLGRNVSLDQAVNPVFEKNRITGNRAYQGGGLYCQYTGVTLLNNFLSGNQAENNAGAIYFEGGPLNLSTVTQIFNNTITSNIVNGQDGEAGSIYSDGNIKVLLMNDIFYGNQAATSDELRIITSTVKLYCCDIDTVEINGEWTGENNFYADPEFIDGMAWDCLNGDAPCSESGIGKVIAFNQAFDAPVNDILGNMRPQDEFIDVGAREVKMCFVGLPEVVSRQSSVSSYPNPFSSSATFEYTLKEAGMASLKIFNQTGQQVALLVNDQQTEGKHQVLWNAEGISAGIYYFSLTRGGLADKGKLIVVK